MFLGHRSAPLALHGANGDIYVIVYGLFYALNLLKITSTQILGTLYACANSVYQAAFPSPERPGYEATVVIKADDRNTNKIIA